MGRTAEERQTKERQQDVRVAFATLLKYLPEGPEKQAISWAWQHLDPVIQYPDRAARVVGSMARIATLSEEDADMYRVLERLLLAMDV